MNKKSSALAPEVNTWGLDELAGADLRGEDLTEMDRLLPEHLAGADLTNARLPTDIEKFPALEQVKAISGEARKIFIGLLAACVYSWLVIGTTTDVALILNTASSPLPIINTPIPIAGFYVVAAAILAAVYCYFHFYLQRLWRTLATLPAVFPDGTSLDDKTDPWLLTNLVRTDFRLLRAYAPPLARLENLLTVFLAWWLVPLTIIALWARYLPAHYWLGSSWLVLLIFITTLFGRHTYRLARAALRDPARPLTEQSHECSDASTSILARAWHELCQLHPDRLSVGLAATLIVCSFSAFRDNPRHDYTWVAKFLNLVGIRTYADLREVDVAQRPEFWTGKEWNSVKQVELRGRDLSFADATRAFLANADLRGANLTGAILEGSELQGALLYDQDHNRPAQIAGVNLRNAQLQGVDLAHADLRKVDLYGAQLQGANLSHADLRRLWVWHVALQGAVLREARLQGAIFVCGSLSWGHEGNIVERRDCVGLQGADFSKADLRGAGLVGIELQGAIFSGANLQGANLRGADLRGTDFSCFQDDGELGRQIFCANLQGAILRGADLRLSTIDTSRVRSGFWQLADLRDIDVRPTENIKAFVNEFVKTIDDQDFRSDVVERLRSSSKKFQSGMPMFPDDWKRPDIMFNPTDEIKNTFRWGDPKWVTAEAYENDRADFLAGLACREGAATGLLEGFVAGVLDPRLSFPVDRTYARRFAERVVGPNCPPARELPDWMRRQLEQLAANRETMKYSVWHVVELSAEEGRR